MRMGRRCFSTISPASLLRSFFSLPNHPTNPFSTLASLAKSKSSIFSSPSSLSATIPFKSGDPSADVTDLASSSCGVFSDVEEARIEIPAEELFIPPEVDVGSSSLSVRVLKGSNIVLSGYARDAQITQAEFVKSSKRKEECPADRLPEFALVGRSNVGKSSLLNSLVRRKKLALTSKKSGRCLTTFLCVLPVCILGFFFSCSLKRSI